MARVRRSIVALAGTAALIGAPVAVANKRHAHDPCGHNEHRHLTHTGLHCGAIFEIPGHRTSEPPKWSEPYRCNSEREEIPGINDFAGALDGDWGYWANNGEWVL